LKNKSGLCVSFFEQYIYFIALHCHLQSVFYFFDSRQFISFLLCITPIPHNKTNNQDSSERLLTEAQNINLAKDINDDCYSIK